MKQWKTSPYPPRRWQEEAVHAVRHQIERVGSAPVVVSAVMGAGKSSVIGELARTYHTPPDDPRMVVITTPTVNLVEQLAETVEQYTGDKCGRFYGTEKSLRPVTVVCMPSIAAFTEAMKARGIACRVWIADEAHRTECATILDTHEALNPSRSIGMTATPFRSDKNERLSLWEEVAYTYTASQAIEDGVVVPIKSVLYEGEPLSLDKAAIAMIQDTIGQGYGPGIVNARDISDAEEFCIEMNFHQIPTKTVHSKNTPSQNERHIQMLKDGELKALVHVNMLAEGANFPWLEWLCLRRPTASRVRFCQEVGRIIRTHGTKSHGLVLDPLNLFDSFGLTDDYAAVLAGGAISADEEEKTPEDEAAEELNEILDMLKDSQEEREEKMAKCVAPTVSWISRTKLALKMAGVLEEEISSTHWRSQMSSNKQMGMAAKMYPPLARRLPDHHASCAIAAGRLVESGFLKKGAASDFLSIAFTVTKHGWPKMAEELVS